MIKQVKASEIINSLAIQHREDVTVEELTLGPAGSRRMDFFALVKTWSPITAIGYEVKVSYSDFSQDKKWHSYLPACHLFYFACPWKLILPDEIPDGIGLKWMTQTGKMVTKKRPTRMEPDSKLLQNALVRAAWREDCTHEARSGSRVDRARDFNDRVKAAAIGEESARILGYKNISSFRNEKSLREDAEDIARDLQYVVAWARSNDIDLNHAARYGGNTIARQLEALLEGCSPGLEESVRLLKDSSESLLKRIDRARGKAR